MIHQTTFPTHPMVQMIATTRRVSTRVCREAVLFSAIGDVPALACNGRSTFPFSSLPLGR